MLRTEAKDASNTISELIELSIIGYVPAVHPLPNKQDNLEVVDRAILSGNWKKYQDVLTS